MGREKVIAVSWPNYTTVDHLSPSHVTVLRCSGGCDTNHQSCVASRKKSRQVAVMLGRCKQENRGRCEKECNSVQVEDEVECECGCRRKREECLENQEWKSETCECLCKDRKARRECLEWGNGKVWDSTNCECVCFNTLECTNGQFDVNTCMCQKIPAASIEFHPAVSRTERSNILIDSWSFIVIFILSGLLLILFLIITYLLCKIRSLKTINETSQSDPYVMPRQLYEKDSGLSFKTLSKSSISDISSCPQCSLEAQTDSSTYTGSDVSNVRSTLTQKVHPPSERCSFLLKET